MQHHPHAGLLIETQLDKVIACSKRAEMHQVVGILQTRELLADTVEPANKRGPGLDDRGGGRAPGSAITLSAPHIPPMRHRPLNRGSNGLEVVGQVMRHQRGARRHHAAADVHAHRRRDHRTLGGDHGPYRCADADMDIRHGGDMFEDEGHLGCTRQLDAGLVIDGHAARPHLDGHAAFDILKFVSRVSHIGLL